LLSTDEMK